MTDVESDVEARAAFYGGAARFAPFVGVVDRDGAFFLVPTGDDHIGRKLFVHRTRGEVKVLRTVVRALRRLRLPPPDGGTFVDVGANIGTSTIAALRAQGFARAVACEPAPDNLRLLRANLALNGLGDRVRIVEAAVSDERGSAVLATHLTNSGGHQLVAGAGPLEAGPQAPLGPRVPVVATTLAALVRRGHLRPGRVRLLWLDVQGHEGHVLRGARPLTRRGVPVVAELFPEALRKSGGFDLLLEEATSAYTHFAEVDALRRDADADAFAPVRELASLLRTMEAPEGRRLSDVLLVRLPATRSRSAAGRARG